MTGFRLPGGGTGIDRGRPIAFRFDGRGYMGFEGDTLASALIANAVTPVARSFKYHRPRGVIGTGFAETNALVQLGHGDRLVPNIPATLVPLTDGLEAMSGNRWPSVRFDLGRITDRLSGLLGAGFYYKTFLWPGWRWFEPWIRRAAGIGRAPGLPDPDRYEARERHVGVLVVGAGAAGIAAAESAAKTGADVVLLDADTRIEADIPGVTHLPRTTAIGYYDGDFVTAVEEVDTPHLRQRLWKFRCDQVVIATGAFERPLLFARNDHPGVMLASAVHAYIGRFGVAPGRAPLFATTDDGAYAAAFAAQDAGLDVRGIVDARAGAAALAGEALARGIPLFAGSRIGAALGGRRVKGADIIGPAGRHRIACDVIAMAGGWSPAVQLFSQSGGTTRHDPALGGFVPDRAAQATHVCGMAAGILDRDAAIASGRAAGDAAARGAAPIMPPPSLGTPPPRLPLPASPKHAFVDMQTDVTVADLALATRENYRSVEHVKRYTVWGMGTDQGRLSATNGVEALARLQGREPGALGTTRYRPPFAPVAIATLAADRPNGALFRPWRELPGHRWHEARGAVFEDFGHLRPSYYPLPGETMAAAARREALAVRSGVGIMESSSFGKIELKGPEAGALLDRLSVGRPSTIPVGRIRYNLLCDELGVLIDDGVVSRLADDHFLLNASSAHADRVRGWIEDWHQGEWPLDCVTRDVTEEWAVWTVAGPRARAMLHAADLSIPAAAADFPHLALRDAMLGDMPVRVQRVSFTGEPSYEINVASPLAGAAADRLWAAGAAFGLVPFGIEALEILRMEKGYLHVGSDTDGTTRPGDIGWGRLARREGDFLGKRSIQHPSSSAPGRRQFVGLRPVHGRVVPPVGAHIVGGRPHPSQGFVTSACFSPTLEAGIALALLADGRARHGETVTLWSEGATWPAIVTSPRFFDADGHRLDG